VYWITLESLVTYDPSLKHISLTLTFDLAKHQTDLALLFHVTNQFLKSSQFSLKLAKDQTDLALLFFIIDLAEFSYGAFLVAETCSYSQDSQETIQMAPLYQQATLHSMWYNLLIHLTAQEETDFKRRREGQRKRGGAEREAEQCSKGNKRAER